MFSVDEFLRLRWAEYSGNPIIEPRFPSPIIGDPTFLHPDQTPDGQWHLIAYSLMGIHAFVSRDGLSWERRELIDKRSIRPFILKHQDIFYLLSEKIIEVFPTPRSYIEIRQSRDLHEWSAPVPLLKPSLPWHFEGTRLGTVGNPCLTIDHEGNFLLYYSAGTVFLSDCWFWEPKYIGVAKSKDIMSGYVTQDAPVISPSYNDKYGSMGSGSIKVLALDDGFVGFQNGIYWDTEIGHSASAIRPITSYDGITWNITHAPILKPQAGWKKSHVYAFDFKPVKNTWIMYFNARDGWLFGKERIGRVTAQITD